MHKLKNRNISSKEEINETDNLIDSNNSDSKFHDSEYEKALTAIGIFVCFSFSSKQFFNFFLFIGFGRFHLILLFLCSLANASKLNVKNFFLNKFLLKFSNMKRRCHWNIVRFFCFTISSMWSQNEHRW